MHTCISQPPAVHASPSLSLYTTVTLCDLDCVIWDECDLDCDSCVTWIKCDPCVTWNEYDLCVKKTCCDLMRMN